MTSREKMTAFLNKEKFDKLPCLEWAPWWDLTLTRWKEEGLDTNVCPIELERKLGLDADLLIWIVNGLSDECPKFKAHGYISNEAEYDKLRPHLYNREKVRATLEQYKPALEENAKNGDIFWFILNGFFWFPRKLFGIEDHLYSFYDQPKLYHRICEDMTEYYLFAIEEISKFSPQYMTFAEDMSYNLGPMLSEETFDEFLKPYYNQIIPKLHDEDIKVFVDSDGDVTKMVPWLIDAGVDGVSPLERQAGVDIDKLTAEYPDFLFLGGFDKLVIKNGEKAMKEEFERLRPSILRGNYLPSMDHQTPPEVSLANYKTYVDLLKQALFAGASSQAEFFVRCSGCRM
jgi:uroporphyrinogen-III decarboxylase